MLVITIEPNGLSILDLRMLSGLSLASTADNNSSEGTRGLKGILIGIISVKAELNPSGEGSGLRSDEQRLLWRLKERCQMTSAISRIMKVEKCG